MRALSVRNPHAYLLVNGPKDCENRGWIPGKWFTVPQRIYIHASIETDYVDMGELLRKMGHSLDVAKNREIASYIDRLQRTRLRYTAKAWREHAGALWGCGALIGEVTVTGFAKNGFASPWAERGSKQWIVQDPVAYTEPIPYKGQLGLFDVVLP